jgi:hypothetical protein
MPQRPYAGSLAEYVKAVFALLKSILLGFLWHGWRPLNDGHAGGEDAGKPRTFPSQHHSISGYSSAGCAPAEPASASPDNLCQRLVGRSMGIQGNGVKSAGIHQAVPLSISESGYELSALRLEGAAIAQALEAVREVFGDGCAGQGLIIYRHLID